ncbi:MAG: Uma2 family endonuclease, partial [Burkholderiales bacterium]|nr:Uma2 family endonuclease [Burkholderiales bacterium]
MLEAPLSSEELAARYRELCDDPRFENLPGKIEIDSWGQILMSPASNYHGILQGRLCQRLAVLGGQVLVEASVVTATGLRVADVAWTSDEFMREHGSQTPFTRAPELCIEIASPSNSLKQLREKIGACLASGAVEAWIAYPQSKRTEFFGAPGALQRSAYAV